LDESCMQWLDGKLNERNGIYVLVRLIFAIDRKAGLE
jgi:hypothetical protein